MLPECAVGHLPCLPGRLADVLSMVFKLANGAENHRRVLSGPVLIAKVITGIQFKTVLKRKGLPI